MRTKSLPQQTDTPGRTFVNEEQLNNEKRRIVNLLEERLVDSGARWKLEALQALDDENSNREVNIFREAENKMLERIATDRVLERVNENQDYSGARPEILNVAVDYLEEEAEKLYPKDEKAREKFIENSKLQFQRKYILENNQLNLEAVERTLAEKEKQMQRRSSCNQEMMQQIKKRPSLTLSNSCFDSKPNMKAVKKQQVKFCGKPSKT